MSSKSVFDEIIEAILNFDSDKVLQSSKKALDMGIAPAEIVEKAIAKALGVVGRKFESGELFLFDLIASGDVVNRAMKELLEPELIKSKVKRKSSGKVIIGSVQGDIHSIGKNIVAAMFTANGFEVFDLGEDVPLENFLKKAKEVNADIVGASALLSTTLPQQRELVKAFISQGLRERVKLMFGGAPVTEEWVKEIGGDGYAENAVDAVKLAKSLLARAQH
jgi:corrinoid protein of di/trimethylamine methyltransferase